MVENRKDVKSKGLLNRNVFHLWLFKTLQISNQRTSLQEILGEFCARGGVGGGGRRRLERPGRSQRRGWFKPGLEAGAFALLLPVSCLQPSVWDYRSSGAQERGSRSGFEEREGEEEEEKEQGKEEKGKKT